MLKNVNPLANSNLFITFAIENKKIVMVTLIGFIKGEEEYQIKEYSEVFCKDDTEANEIGLNNCLAKKWCNYQINNKDIQT